MTPADEFLTHACLTYAVDSPTRRAHALTVLQAHPEIATNPHVAAALGDPTHARHAAPGGPRGWEPLLYLAYSRVPQANPVAAAEQLLAQGADPNAAWHWNDEPSPFTVLTGVLGEGEDAANRPRHQAEIPLATLLLNHGADPNDNQALYNRMFNPDDSHLHLLFRHGLGTERPHRPLCRPPDRMLHDLLLWAAANTQPDRVRLLLDHGVPPTQPYPGHPVHQRRSAIELALRNGNPTIAAMLSEAGAPAPRLSPADAQLADLMAGKPTTADPATIAQNPDAVQRAAEQGKDKAIRALLSAGFPFGLALHHAALAGRATTVETLLALGADPAARDPHHATTPAVWAAHNNHAALALRLSRARRPTPPPASPSPHRTP
ncbi:ankyrin repeat domain-containing protein [Actinokineospora pegani]|uniref:ankyrin repeat domain-containing protein n=1 Tax=Actinokineospora pegani TaxID=2654637 RepID=UPI0012EA192E|nr:ankyrin repeat domain-containing protein [Actinokineospora pegani]